jgi:hypothetical protein
LPCVFQHGARQTFSLAQLHRPIPLPLAQINGRAPPTVGFHPPATNHPLAPPNPTPPSPAAAPPTPLLSLRPNPILSLPPAPLPPILSTGALPLLLATAEAGAPGISSTPATAHLLPPRWRVPPPPPSLLRAPSVARCGGGWLPDGPHAVALRSRCPSPSLPSLQHGGGRTRRPLPRRPRPRPRIRQRRRPQIRRPSPPRMRPAPGRLLPPGPPPARPPSAPGTKEKKEE